MLADRITVVGVEREAVFDDSHWDGPRLRPWIHESRGARPL